MQIETSCLITGQSAGHTIRPNRVGLRWIVPRSSDLSFADHMRPIIPDVVHREAGGTNLSLKMDPKGDMTWCESKM